MQPAVPVPRLPAPSVSRPLAPSLDLSSVYEIADLDQVDGLYDGRLDRFFYARDGHPNAVQLAAKMARSEGAEAGLVCASGMAAIASTVLDSARPGRPRGHLRRTLRQDDHPRRPRNGPVRRRPTTASIPPNPEPLASLITPRTRLVLVETLSNPLLRVADLEAIARIAREADVPLMVDQTFAPLLCRPLELGATFVMHSVTKLIGGHSDLTLGVVVGPRERDRQDPVRRLDVRPDRQPVRELAGPARSGDPEPALGPRERHGAGPGSPPRDPSFGVASVSIPGLPSHPDFELARRMFKNGFGAMVDLRRGRPGAGRPPDPIAPSHPLRPQPGRCPDHPQPPVLDQPPRPGPGNAQTAGNHPRPDPPFGRPRRSGRPLGRPVPRTGSKSSARRSSSTPGLIHRFVREQTNLAAQRNCNPFRTIGKCCVDLRERFIQQQHIEQVVSGGLSPGQ